MPPIATCVHDGGAPAPFKMTEPKEHVPPKREGLKQRLFRAARWTLVGYACTQVLRLGSNLILARLLAPEMFGVMAIGHMVIIGLRMFSDVGLGSGTIQSRRGDDPDYLNVVWIVQIVRGGLITLCGLMFASGLMLATNYGFLPAHSVYADPLVPKLVALLSISGLISGFDSTKIWWARRHLALAKLTKIELGSQLATTAFILAWAAISPSVWALAFGWLFSASLVMLMTHLALPGPSNRFKWDRTAFGEILHFGKWTFVSSALSFLLTSGDRLLMGGFLTTTLMGLYSIAFELLYALQAVVIRLVGFTVLPALSEVARERPEQLRQTLYRVRLPLDVACVVTAGMLTILGPSIVGLLYDKRYSDVGWMLSVLATTLLATRLGVFDQCLLAMGRPKLLSVLNGVRLVALYVSVPTGYLLFGIEGAVGAVACSALVNSVVVLTLQSRLRLLDIRREMLVVPLYALGLLAGWTVRWILR